MRRLLLALLLFTALIVFTAAGCKQNVGEEISTPKTVTEAWVVSYSQAVGNNIPAAMAVDEQGNIYVTGAGAGISGQNDYATVKYDGSGNQIWAATYNGGGDDKAHALAIDPAGNVYVTGESGSDTYKDYATIKYDRDGNQLWAARYNGPASAFDAGLAIAVDRSGNVCVTGRSYDLPDNVDYATLKYDSAGNRLWERRYDYSIHGGEKALSLAVDPAGNIYITGWSVGKSTLYEYATIKYDSAGNQVWLVRYDSKGGEDLAQALALDESGNVYVTGTSADEKGSNDYATVKYDNAGNQLWAARYDGPKDDDRASSLALDNSGNVYVTGFSKNKNGLYDFATVKYDRDGNQLWVSRYNSPVNGEDRAVALATDQTGNVYVTGFSAGKDGSSDYVTIKYDTSGQVRWIARYSGSGKIDDRAIAVVVDKSSNIFVTGNSLGTYTTIKYIQQTP